MQEKNDSPEQVRHLTSNGGRWLVRPPWESILFDAAGFRLDSWLASGEARVVRSVGRRSVYRVQIDSSAIREQQNDSSIVCTEQSEISHHFFVKHYRCRGVIDVLKNLVRRIPARREWKNVQEALRRGIATAQPIALGEQMCGGLMRDSYFVSEEIADAVSLERFTAENCDSVLSNSKYVCRRQAIEELARFVAALHEAGLRHDDFHAGNILVQYHSRRQPCNTQLCDDAEAIEQCQPTPLRFFLIDLAAASFGDDPLNWTESRKNLVVLNAQWRDRCTPHERWRFWRTYLQNRPTLVAFIPQKKILAHDLDRASREHSRRIDRSRDRRSTRTNRDFYSLRRRGNTTMPGNGIWQAHAVVDLPHRELEKLLDCPRALLLDNLHRPVKLGHSSMIVRATLELADGQHEICYKQCRSKNRRKAFVNLFRSGRAMRGWRLGHAFLSRGIATPRPIVVCRQGLDKTSCSTLDRSDYLATEWIEDAKNLHLWAWELTGRAPGERDPFAQRCADLLGRLVGRMHARQVSHGDLKGSNILVVGDEKALRVYLIDLDAARIHRRLPLACQAADLARLAVSLTAHPWVGPSFRRRFWTAYQREFPRGGVSRQQLWRAVARLAKKILAKKQKRGDVVL